MNWFTSANDSLPYVDRQQAGRVLARHLAAYTNHKDCVVLALPRGGVPVGYEIAKSLHIPLDVFIVRKLGVPSHQELAMGALASGGVVFWNDTILKTMQITPTQKEAVLQSETQELLRREKLYRGGRPFPSLTHKTVLLVDDGIATGATMKAALLFLKHMHAHAIHVAVPVAASETAVEIAAMAQHFTCPLQPKDFNAVGLWYEHFPQTTDEEVIQLLTPFSTSSYK